MSNGFQNPVMYTDETLRVLENNIVLGKHVSRKHQMEFGKDSMKIGDTLNIRRPAKVTVNSGATFTAVDYTETSVPLVISNQRHVDNTFTSKELTLNMQDFSDRVIKPGAIQLAQQIDIDGYINAKNTVGALSGTPATAPNNVSFLFGVGKTMDDFSTPRDGQRRLALDQGTNASLVASITGFFNSQNLVGKQYEDGIFVDATNTIGLKIAMSQNVARHTVGPQGGTPAVSGASQSLTAGWANTGTLITSGWTAAAASRLNVGDVFTIGSAGTAVNSVNPVTHQNTGQLMQFVVTTAFSSDASGNGTISFTPAIISAGPFQNVASVPASGALLAIAGAANAIQSRSIAWHYDAFELAVVKMVDLAEFGGWGAVRSQNGFSLRVFRQAAISSDTVGNRTDALYGWSTPYQEQACQLVGT